MEDESLSLQRSVFIGQHLESITYGINLTIYPIIVYYLICQQSAEKKYSWGFLLYLFLLFAASTISTGAGIRFAQLTWIEHQNSPVTFFNKRDTHPVSIVGMTAYIFSGILGEGLLVWRCYVFYRGVYWLIGLVILGYLTTTGISLVALYEFTRPIFFLARFTPTYFNMAIPFWSLSIASNFLLSFLLVARLLWHRRNMTKTLGSESGKLYKNLAEVFIESAGLYLITSLVHIITFAKGDDVHFLIFGTLVQLEALAPRLILLRAALGHSTSIPKPSTTRTMTHLSFATRAAELESTGSGYNDTQDDNLSLDMNHRAGCRKRSRTVPI